MNVSPNPYTPYTPASNEERFFGREDAFEWIWTQVQAQRLYIAIYGPPRIGKTSLLLQLPNQLSSQVLAVYLDLAPAEEHPAPSLWNLANQLGRDLIERGLPISMPAPEPFEHDAVRAWETYLSIVAASTQRPLVLLWDHADRAEAALLEQLLHTPAVTHIFAATNLEALREKLPGLEWVAYKLGKLETEEAEALVKSPIDKETCFIDPWAVRRLLEISSHHPYYLQLLCAATFDLCSERGEMMPLDVDRAVKELLDRPIPEFILQWETALPREQAILAVLAALKGTVGLITADDIYRYLSRRGSKAKKEEIETLLEDLTRRDILEHLGAGYRFSVELFRLWIEHHHPAEKTLRSGPWKIRRTTPAPSVELTPTQWGWIGGGLLLAIALALLLLLLRPWQPSQRPTPTVAIQTPRAAVTLPSLPSTSTTSHPDAILYTARKDSESPWQIYLRHLNEETPIQLTHTQTDEESPAWSPDGETIFFTSWRDGNREIYRMKADGTDPVNLTQNSAHDWMPAISPDGQHIAFCSYRDGNWEIYLMDIDGKNTRRLTEHAASDLYPAWSPDGRSLLFSSKRTGDDEIYLLDLESGALQRLTNSPADDFDPAWSPDGQWIAFVSTRNERTDIFLIHPDGSGLINLTEDHPFDDDFDPAWSPDGRKLAFVSYRDGDFDIYIIDLASGTVENLTNNTTPDRQPAWQP